MDPVKRIFNDYTLEDLNFILFWDLSRILTEIARKRKKISFNFLKNAWNAPFYTFAYKISKKCILWQQQIWNQPKVRRFLIPILICLLFSIKAIFTKFDFKWANTQNIVQKLKIYIFVNIYHSPFDSHLVLYIEGQIHICGHFPQVENNKYYI